MNIPFLNKKLSPKYNHNKTLRSGSIYIYKEKIDLRKLAKEYEFCDFYQCDLSNNDNIYWLQNKKFYNCSFHTISFGTMADHGNLFDDCLFEYVDFKKSILGYDATRYMGR